MSQLYQLFCEGLSSEGGVARPGLSSTVLFTSTPLEDDDDDEPSPTSPTRHPQPEGNGEDGSPTERIGEANKEAQTETQTTRTPIPNLSVQTQVGSASTSEGSPTAGPGPAKHTENGDKVHSPARASLPEPLKEKNGNGSSVDFIDHVIAAKRREKVLGLCRRTKRIRTIGSASESQNSHPKDGPGRRASESSDTDFEGAPEYYKRHPSLSTPAQTKTVQTNSSPKKVRDSLKSTSGESLNLVLESGSSSSDVSIEGEIVKSPSAARCRVHIKPRNRKSRSPECSPPITEETSNERNIQPCSQTVVTQAPVPDKRVHDDQEQCIQNLTSNDSVSIWKGVVAYVEVRFEHDNRSMGVRNHLKRLGATVLDKFTKEVTHVVFNQGSLSTLKRAKKLNCHLVSVLWIDECKKLGKLAPENEHPPLDMHLYENQFSSTKYRKMKSLQPDFEEGKSEERLNEYVKRRRRKVQRATASQQTNQCVSSEEYEEEPEEEDPSDKHISNLVPKGVHLRSLSIVLNRVDVADASNESNLRKNLKRRLMPLGYRPPSSLSLEDFDTRERLRPECPYHLDTAPKQKFTQQTQRKVVISTPSTSKIISKRRSSCFVPGSRSQRSLSQHRPKKVKTPMPTMVCTFMHRREIDVVAAVIKQLGGWILEPTVSARTTHVVCGDSKRTINLLRGIAHGCWVLHKEWVMRSLESGRWLDEEPFELTVFPAVQQSRIARETLGVCPDIFSSANAIHVAKNTTPPRADLIDLLKLCGAQTVSAPRQAKIIVGQYQKRTSHSNVAVVSEQWVLDSIQENMLLSLRHYHI